MSMNLKNNIINRQRISQSLVAASLSLAFMACDSKAPKEEVKSNFDLTGKKAWVYTTADSTNLKLTQTGSLDFQTHSQPFETETMVFVDPTQTFQTLLGIGGALTDASAETFTQLPQAKQDELMKAYYDQESGIGYTLARTHINSCDFSSASYTYVTEGDKELASFDIKPDQTNRIPFIKKAIEAAGGKLTLYVSPWSPPAWMKDNKNMLQGGKLLPEFRQSWANYYTKFIKAYEAEGIPVWGLTVQNEPMAKQIWESCIFTAEEERDFIKEYLGPTLKNEGLSDKKLVAWDHNRDQVYQRASTLLSDPEAAQYIWGIGYHWYEDWSGGEQMFANVSKVKESFPETNLLFTEGCNFPYKTENLPNWNLGERYGLSMINDFNSGAVGWTDWNILLDETGGPNHVGNFCFAPVHGHTQTGELTYTNSYYYIGHFSKFIRPGAKRVQTTPSRSNLLSTAFLNTDGSLVVVVMNPKDKEADYSVWINNQAVKSIAKPHSISTFVIK